eukprot:2488223-Prymnesium_polylepis.1
MPGGEDASPGHAGELVARSCVVCRPADGGKRIDRSKELATRLTGPGPYAHQLRIESTSKAGVTHAVADPSPWKVPCSAVSSAWAPE